MSSSLSITMKPIGIIRTPFTDKYDAPRQPGANNIRSEGIITLFPKHNYEQALKDLEGFERIWILSWFHKNTAWKANVLPPRSKTKKGVFATRSPHRPNPIGLSLCKLIAVNGRTIRVEHPDLLDETPILDIKPYIPYADAFLDSAIGWLEDIEKGPINEYHIEVGEIAARQAEWLKIRHTIELLDRAKIILANDPLPHEYRRTDVHPKGGFVLAIKSWRVLYDINDRNVIIHSIESGYPLSVISEGPTNDQSLHDADAHKEFHRQWSKGD